jgi:hypothetical protein
MSFTMRPYEVTVHWTSKMTLPLFGAKFGLPCVCGCVCGMEERDAGVELPPAPKIEQTPSTGNTANSNGGTQCSGGSAPVRASYHSLSLDADEGMPEGQRASLTVYDRKRSYTETYCFGAVSKRGSAQSAGPSRKISRAPSPESVHSLPIERVPSIEIASGKMGYSAGSREGSCERSSKGSARDHPDMDRTSPPPFQRNGSSGLLAIGTGPLVREISDGSASASGPKSTSSVSSKPQLRSKMDRNDCRSRRIRMGNSTEGSMMEEVEMQEMTAHGEVEESSRRDDVSWLEQSYSAALRDDHEYLALPPPFLS